MTLYEFNTLTDDEKANAVWAGSFLADRQQDEFKIQLYAVGNFYVELFYHAAENKISAFRAFNSKHLLAPYLAQISYNL